MRGNRRAVSRQVHVEPQNLIDLQLGLRSRRTAKRLTHGCEDNQGACQRLSRPQPSNFTMQVEALHRVSRQGSAEGHGRARPRQRRRSGYRRYNDVLLGEASISDEPQLRNRTHRGSSPRSPVSGRVGLSGLQATASEIGTPVKMRGCV
jgi:hypothetical protein